MNWQRFFLTICDFSSKLAFFVWEGANWLFFATQPFVGLSSPQTHFWLFFACNFQIGFSSYRATIYFCATMMANRRQRTRRWWRWIHQSYCHKSRIHRRRSSSRTQKCHPEPQLKFSIANKQLRPSLLNALLQLAAGLRGCNSLRHSSTQQVQKHFGLLNLIAIKSNNTDRN